MLRRNGFQYGCLSLYVAQIFNISKAVKKLSQKEMSIVFASPEKEFSVCVKLISF